jgi:hypothetical protein
MPFKVIKVKGGYKVKKETPPGQTFSKKPLTKKKAEAQMRALYLHTK